MFRAVWEAWIPKIERLRVETGADGEDTREGIAQYPLSRQSLFSVHAKTARFLLPSPYGHSLRLFRTRLRRESCPPGARGRPPPRYAPPASAPRQFAQRDRTRGPVLRCPPRAILGLRECGLFSPCRTRKLPS